MKNSTLVTRIPMSGTPSPFPESHPCLEPHPHVMNPIPMSGTPSPCQEPHPLSGTTPHVRNSTHVRNPIPMSGTPPLVWNPIPMSGTSSPCLEPLQMSPPPEKEIWVFPIVASFPTFPMFVSILSRVGSISPHIK